ncbi:MAG TPA: 2-oxoacid:acceptor oxidoreductase family protein [Terriglobales bacterium]|nr:2-oxoacid:acceptor oxidoreductase family protein [Terriglobales bacterium]
MPLTEIRIAGFGGQGVILSAVVLGKACSIHQGQFATMTQNFGPEARGGACSAQLILSDTPVLYPYVTQPDIMLVMSQEAYVKFGPELKDGGMLLIERDLVRVTDVPKQERIYSIPATRIAEELGKRMVLNIVMVGFFTAVTRLLDADAVRKAVADSVPASFRELNLKAFDKGYEYGVAALAAGPERPDLEQSAAVSQEVV